MAELSEALARELPYLRRYARAVTGTQEQGDLSVRRCLERMFERGLAAEAEAGELRLTLYQGLHEIWRDEVPRPAGSGERSLANSSIIISRIEHLTPLKRQILILTTLEGFSLAQTAAILDLDPAEAAGLLEAARTDMQAQEPTRILIIEDEPVIALDVANTVRQDGHTVVGIATTRAEAVELAARTRPGLVLADIKLADDSSGLDAVNQILRDHAMPVIFITAFPERLLSGERPEPILLITKPFDHDILRVSISQALTMRRSAGEAA
jgi:CheY-like chemotaxis protein/DNA-directed RNA polymerase specialized sigma24 family protein